MKMKKLLLLALIMKSFSVNTALAWEWTDVKTGIEILGGLATTLIAIPNVYTQWVTYLQNKETHENNKASHKLDATSKIQNQNTAYLASLKEIHVTLTEAAKRKKSDKKLDLELKASEKALQNFRAFTTQGKFDKEIYNPETTYEAKDLEKIKTDENKATDTKKPDTSKQPGFFRKTANAIMVPVSLAQSTANKVADILPINVLLSRIAEHESLKNTFFDKHKRDIGGVLVTATIAALSYKAYSWYYNEARITAGETIIELEEQAKLITAQYKQEMKRTDLSSEDKAKLKKAYIQYMKQLKENIRQQKIAAGYNVYRNLLIGAVITAIGLPTLIKYYPDELKKIFSYGNTSQEAEIKTDGGAAVITSPNSDNNPNSATPNQQSVEQTNTEKTQSTLIAQEGSENQLTPTTPEDSEKKSQENSSEVNSSSKRFNFELLNQDIECARKRVSDWWNTPREPMGPTETSEQAESSANNDNNSQEPQDSQN